MNSSNWWFKFDFRRWRTDTDLRECSLETRGFWLEVLCVMYEKNDYQVTTTIDRWARLIGCTTNEVTRCFRELSDTKTADVTFGNGEVTVLSRRLKRELTSKESNRLRVQKHRGNANVTPMSQDRVISKSKSNNKEEEEEAADASHATEAIFDSSIDLIPEIDTGDITQTTLAMAAFGTYEAAFKPNRLSIPQREMIAVKVEDLRAWQSTIDFWVGNGYRPKSILKMLEYYDEEVRGEHKKNASTKSNGFGRKRTDQDVFAESADFYANYDEHPIA